jgi:CYTH domain-containing protein
VLDFIKSLLVLFYSKNLISESELDYLILDLDVTTKPEELAKKIIQISKVRFSLEKEEEKYEVDNYI